MACKFSKADLRFTALQFAANLLGVKFLDYLILGSPDFAEGRGFGSTCERSDDHLKFD